MGLGIDKGSNTRFASIKEGSIRVKTTEDDTSPNLVKREYTNPTTKEDGVAYELKYAFLDGFIENIEFDELDWGKVLNITIDGITLSINTSSRFGTDFMMKLPNIDLSKEVRIRPYDFESKDNGKRIVGLSIMQGESKIQSFFTEKTKDGKFKSVNGIPEVKPEDYKKFDKDDWNMHFTKVKKFLIEYTEKKVLPKANFIEVDLSNAKEGKLDDLMNEPF